MRSIRHVLVIAGLAILLFDVAWSIASRAFGLSYSLLAPVSFLIYACAGFAAARRAGVWLGVAGGGLVALVDATLGWTLSWIIGPGRPPNGFEGWPATLSVIIVVVASGALLGLVGGGISKLGTSSK